MNKFSLRCVRTILKRFSCEEILEQNYAYSESGIYKCPDSSKLDDFKRYVSELPIREEPEIFGMHENANVVYETKEANFFLSIILESQMKASNLQDSSSDKVVLDLIHKIKSTVAKSLNVENMNPMLLKTDEKGRNFPLTTVILQEIERFNKLLKVVHGSLSDLEKGIKGLIVMSDTLEAIFDSFLMNQVPQLWNKNGYLSTKSLSSWTEDFIIRIEHIQSWIKDGQPSSSWISGFFFPQSFLTAVLQTHARKYSLPIDFLKFDFEILETTLSQKEIFEQRQNQIFNTQELYKKLKIPEDGIYVHGLFIEAGKWDNSRGGLCDADIRELTSVLPVLWLKPCRELQINNRYDAPLYKTPVRAGRDNAKNFILILFNFSFFAGVLSTTGHSTNFVLSILIKSRKMPSFWTLRGTALVTLLTD